MKTENLTLLDLYKGKKVVVTGHTGFKGSWLSICLNLLGADVYGIALSPRTDKDNFVLSGIQTKITDFRADIRDFKAIHTIIENINPEIMFHLAAQPVVLESYKNPLYTFETNVQGTVNVLEAFRLSNTLHTGVFITSDKCYSNKEWVWGYRENDRLGGHDPYSCSKGASELIIDSYRNSYFNDSSKNIASARAGNVIGGGDWTPYRLVPDCILSLEQEKPLELRNPQSVRPWQHVLEPLFGYLLLGAKMMTQRNNFAQAWNFGPDSTGINTVENLVSLIFSIFGKGELKDVSDKAKLHETRLLQLDISKAREFLNWNPVLTFQETVEMTVEWYKNYRNTSVMEICKNQINSYISKWKSQKEI